MYNYWLDFIVYFILFSNMLFIFITIFIERKNPAVVLSWVLTLVFIPFVGFFLYLLFGRNLRVGKKKLFRLKKKHDEQYSSKILNKIDEKEQLIFFEQEININPTYDDIIKFVLNMANSPYTGNNDIELFTEAEEKYEYLLADIEAAKSSIHLLYYIIRDDEIGRKLTAALCEKARAGVEVRLLYDDAGSMFTPWKMFQSLIDQGGMVKRFFPLSLGTYFRLNFRNHRKIAVIDGKIGYLGGMNIGNEYMGLDTKLSPWRDTHLRLTGEAVYLLQLRFLEDWVHVGKEKDLVAFKALPSFFPVVEEAGNHGMQIVSSGPDTNDNEIKRCMLKMIYAAQERIYIQTPYFVPDSAFLEALQSAAMGGVEVCLMIPALPDKKLVYRVTTSYLGDVLLYGVKVYLYPGFLHAKMLVIDDKVSSIGSANMDIRSFALNFEVNAFIYGAEMAEKCAQIFLHDVSISERYDIQRYRQRGISQKIQENILRLFSPLF